MNRWRTAARRGAYVGSIAVVASILLNGTLRGWNPLTQPGFWLWEVIVFAVAAIIGTALFGSGLWRYRRQNEPSES